MTVRLIVRVANYAEMNERGGDHLRSFRTVDVESPQLEELLKLDYGNRAHVEVIGAEVLKCAATHPKAPPPVEAGEPKFRWHLDEETSALLHTMTGSDDAEDATSITLFVGESRDDDGKLVYGLHAYESEYPEEGVIPLVEFDPPAATSAPDERISIALAVTLTKLPRSRIAMADNGELMAFGRAFAAALAATHPKEPTEAAAQQREGS